MIMWRSKVITASNRIFPGLIYHDWEKQYWDAGHLVKSNLPLQMALYFDIWFFPIWFFTILLGLDAKYYNLSGVYKFINISVYLLITCIECLKLYLGYLGNLSEKIPELASFWLISALLQFPLMVFMLLDGNILIFFIEKASTGMMVLLVVFEIITGTIALNNIAAHHLKRFYMAQLCGRVNKFN
ncbi:transmembrane protein 17B isoform X1 [Microplitis demolitor]|uniref:transmembrane protein 17B isoform X1 n=1 Tax=Microplitis demolitor TaxID=69319 RepID=UPI0004CD644A|nr:transmembrane protein 17B isoform X1 [Microplitis demolitor]